MAAGLCCKSCWFFTAKNCWFYYAIYNAASDGFQPANNLRFNNMIFKPNELE